MKWGRLALVLFAAVTITALGIDAADTLSGSRSTLLSQVLTTETSLCPAGMIEVQNIPGLTCADAFEVTVGDACPNQEPQTTFDTLANLNTRECLPTVEKDALPWRFVTRDQAMQACVRAGKRLPTSAEWYALSLGLADAEKNCNVGSQAVTKSGAYASCVTEYGVYDLVGNVWEWVSDDVIDGRHNDRNLPAEGYVAQVDANGMATVTDGAPQPLFGQDYFWSRSDGAYAVIRGGYFDSGTDAGVYTVHADTVPTAASAGIGFRCVR